MKEPRQITKSKKVFLKKFYDLPMPSPKSEKWRYTNILDWDLNQFKSTGQKIDFFDKEKKVIFTDIKTAITEHFDILSNYLPMSLITEEDKFIAQHGALWNDGVFIYVPKNTSLKVPLKNIFNVLNKGGIFSHTIIILEENSSLTYIEEHISEKGNYLCLRNDIVEIYAKTNSKINFYNLQNWNNNVINVSNWKVKLDKDAKINWIFGQFGGKFSRIKIASVFSGQGSKSEKSGVFYSNKDQHYDITTNAIHTVPNTTCNILVKGVLDGKSSSVYRGMIRINKEAQQTNSYLADHSLILSNNAISNSIPSLEIDANDVKASHGATLGKLDEEQIFYLMCRGLSRKQAERLLILGYFQPVIEKIEVNGLKQKFNKSLKKKVEK